jgi:hypothetical protein
VRTIDDDTRIRLRRVPEHPNSATTSNAPDTSAHRAACRSRSGARSAKPSATT